MKLVSCNAFRTIGIPGVTYIKPDLMFKELEKLEEADLVLFPETWQVPSLVHGLKKQIFPSIETIQLGSNKIEMTRALWTVAKEYVPYTEILANTEANIQSILETFPFPFVAKEAKNSMGNGVFLIDAESEFREYTSSNKVLYIQEYLPNDGKDLRVCIIGEEIYAAYWRIGQQGEFLHNVSQGGSVCSQFIPEQALELVLKTAKALNINHAGFDIIVSGGKYYILEFNVLFGNQGLIGRDVTITQAIYDYISHNFSPSTPPTPPTTPQ
ncbi:ribosomal protein S6 glutaminyl transferase [Gracilibacillus boraciitolerans JCM 21714]|uniref:Ribosomal protein S6 glutaminyl transferase n=1 Tax=Gracilibacillus boraciitolerans JCM 21714 TaxID=1298598 RepID=W4VLI1_9BACI|nr:RimK family alpha-L-glutamate ligase [Gracilibacillus boraciitolerans]GAE94240.1 ribosomal protein S6 glutaminyl transferase [Gracilibacillus boraciitolerans JCM 21714]